jgi:hypothetical protein
MVRLLRLAVRIMEAVRRAAPIRKRPGTASDQRGSFAPDVFLESPVPAALLSIRFSTEW